jgi:hypothetical protein
MSAVLFGGLPKARHRHSPARSPVECEKHAPLPGRRVVRGKIQRIVLSIVQGALYTVDTQALSGISEARAAAIAISSAMTFFHMR